jgi:hypothetical protein
MRYSEEGLFRALEQIFRETDKFMDCNELFDYQEVKNYAASANRVSDYLGSMWRKGQLTRLPSNGNSRARWMYQWKEKTPVGVVGKEYAPKLLIDRPLVTVTEEGMTMVVTTPHLTIHIHQTRK